MPVNTHVSLSSVQLLFSITTNTSEWQNKLNGVPLRLLPGQDEEMELFSCVVKSFLEGRTLDTRTYQNVVIYGGGSGYGKSRLLAEVVYRAKRGHLR